MADYRRIVTGHNAEGKSVTVDYIILLKGEVSMLLDEGEVASLSCTSRMY